MITKDNKGITLVALILTIIIMLILATITTYTGIDTYKESKVYAFVSQMQLIQAKVDDLVNTKTIEELKLLGTVVNSNNTINKAFSNNEITSNDSLLYRYFTKQQLFEIFDVEDAYSDVMINFTTREIISTRGVEYEGNTYYTQYKLPNGQALINGDSQINRELDFNLDIAINGINSTVLVSNISIVNATLSFAEIDSEENVISNWQTITNYAEKQTEYTTAISKSGNYIFRLQDNTDRNKLVTKTISVLLTNKPKTKLSIDSYSYGGEDSEDWAYAQKDEVNYVWIPRFVYKTNEETSETDIKFIKGNSNIATDNTYIDDTWTIHEKFTTSDGEGLTGIWINIENISEEELKNKELEYMIELLDSDAETLIEI